MVAAFLDSWLTGDPDEDSVTMEFDRPSWPEIASVAGLAARLYLGGAGTPRRYFAWGQAVRGAVLAVLLVHAAAGLDGLVSVFLPGSATGSSRAARRHSGIAWRRLAAHGVVPGRLRLDRGLRGAGPGALPRGPCYRGAEQEPGSPAPARTAPVRLTIAALSLASLLVTAGLALFG